MTTVYKHSDLFYVKYRPVLAIFFSGSRRRKIKITGSWEKSLGNAGLDSWGTLCCLNMVVIGQW